MEKNTTYMRARDVCRKTGFSYEYLIKNCKNGTIPHIRVGEGKNARFMINLPKYLDQLNQETTNK